MTLSSLLLVVGGFVFLALGAEWLVRGAGRLAVLLGIPPLAVGLTVVAIGTSAPELVVTVGAALDGRSDVALGNVVGSNVLNILLILGVSALIVPLAVGSRLLRWDVPMLVVLSVLVFLLALDGRLGQREGALLLLAGAAYTWLRIRKARQTGIRDIPGVTSRGRALRSRPARTGVLRNVVLTLAGLVLLAAGARWLVDGAVDVARAMGVSELVIGLTLVAAGTSLPEAAASILAALRGERDLAVGNAVGSSLYNLTFVLGAGALAARGGIPVSPGVLGFDLPIMVIVAVACLPIFFTGSRIDRWEGAIFAGYYGAYVGCLFLKAVDHEALPVLSGVMLLFVVPLTVLTLGVITLREVRARRAERKGGREPPPAER